jgi:hypothetical protein
MGIMRNISMSNDTDNTTKANRVNTPIVRVCAWCAHEHLLAQNGNETHGICRRHAIQQFVTMGFGAEAEAKADSICTGDGWCPDLGELQLQSAYKGEDMIGV